ncbi:type II toxin-antitoxin system VapC family toxin [Prosthecobacter sp.]|jgi:predicted nucleic acid-binding protein|uniref:type II toxin-antitoxin system VapC family toxin n=1 Tax=Prosthecobacter sp. TaxID=1965333 RepID=UPI00378371AE
MNLVADASSALGLVLPGHDPAVTQKFRDHLLLGDDIHVPSLWYLETLNVLLVRERRKKITPVQRDEAISILHGLPLLKEAACADHISRILQLGCRHSLSAYDACYLELAIRLAAPLLTADDSLRAAALAEGVLLL